MTIGHQDGAARPDSGNDVAQAYAGFVEHSSQRRTATDLSILNLLRTIHIDSAVRCVDAGECDLLAFANDGKAKYRSVQENKLDHIETAYKAPHSRLSKELGKLTQKIKFGQFEYSWNELTMTLYLAEWAEGWCTHKKQYLVTSHDPQCQSSTDDMLLHAGHHCAQVSEEIYVFDQAIWTKNHELWLSVQKASWEDVILDPDMKKALIEDVLGFYESRDEYEEFGVPWKRGIIVHGKPGNGKTITIKAIMKSLGLRSDPVPSLYVKSFEHRHGPQISIRAIFEHARRRAPCLLVFEDLDSLVTDKVRSYFLNEVDGIESNDGILMIGSTNNLEGIDPAISKRPSRFDRKYLYDLPGKAERLAYCTFWHRKLSENPRVDFPEEICDLVANLTETFSFAYLKELFITSLLVLVRGNVQQEIEHGVDDQKTLSNEEDNANKPKKDSSTTDENESSSPAYQTRAITAVPEALRDNLFFKVLQRQIEVLRKDMASADSSDAIAKHVGKVPSSSDVLASRIAVPMQAIPGLTSTQIAS